MKVHVAVRLAASVTVQVTVVVPLTNVDPEAGAHDALTPGQLSEMNKHVLSHGLARSALSAEATLLLLLIIRRVEMKRALLLMIIILTVLLGFDVVQAQTITSDRSASPAAELQLTDLLVQAGSSRRARFSLAPEGHNATRAIIDKELRDTARS